MADAYVNGTIYSMRSQEEVLTSIVIEGDRFAYCGNDQNYAIGYAKKTGGQVIDLKGQVIVPGMTDAHLHLFSYARDLQKLNLKGCTSKRELFLRIANKVKETPKGEWIIGTGFDHEVFTDDRSLPKRWELDHVSPDNPLIITRYCLHISCANSMALKAGRIGTGYKPDVEGTVEFTDEGEPNGVLRDKAAGDVIALVPNRLDSVEGKADAVAAACRELNKVGITGVHPTSAADYDLPEYANVYQYLRDYGKLTVRVYLGFDQLPGCSISTGLGDDMVKFGFYKLFMDGNMGGRTAYLTEPYADDPGNTGIGNYYDQKELDDKVQKAYDLGIQVAAHAIGDKGCEQIVTSFEHMLKRHEPRCARPFRIIHASLLNRDLIERIAELPVILDVQPMFLATDIRWCESRFGRTRSEYLWCWRKLIDKGIILTGSSDSPCETFNPMYGIYAAVTRQGIDGYPDGGWYPENKINVYEAMCMYTKNPAYASNTDKEMGTIEKGKLADFVALDQDIFRIEPNKIKDIQVNATYLGGKQVFEKI